MKAIHNPLEGGHQDHLTVVTLSKIGKMKAIHNPLEGGHQDHLTVVTLSKIGKMKAIHNRLRDYPDIKPTVVTLSKIGKMKAIHKQGWSSTGWRFGSGFRVKPGISSPSPPFSVSCNVL